MLIGALEAGGTKMVCAIGNEKGEIRERISIPTETPEITMAAVTQWFGERQIEALGIGCFGPVDVDRKSPTYGFITTTPKLAWQNTDIVGCCRKALKTPDGKEIPVGFDTDVNASCLGEAVWGSTRDVDSSMYITVGTGVGAGIMIENRLVHGMMHPEAGHVLLCRDENDHYAGRCPYHRHCLEGLASGPAIEERWGEKAYLLNDRAEVWELEAFYLAQAIVDFIMVLSPQRIVLGGGVMHQEQLYPLIRKKTAELLNGYIQVPELQDLEHYIVPPALEDNQGIMGCIRLAMEAASLL